MRMKGSCWRERKGRGVVEFLNKAWGSLDGRASEIKRYFWFINNDEENSML